MPTLITVLKGGGRYDATWVERLARACAPPRAGLCGGFSASPTFRSPSRVSSACPSVTIGRLWAKMEAFRPGLCAGTALLAISTPS